MSPFPTLPGAVLVKYGAWWAKTGDDRWKGSVLKALRTVEVWKVDCDVELCGVHDTTCAGEWDWTMGRKKRPNPPVTFLMGCRGKRPSLSNRTVVEKKRSRHHFILSLSLKNF